MGELYEHTKTGKIYRTITTCKLESNPEIELIVYEKIETQERFARPLNEFNEPVNINNQLQPRFKLLETR